jgi:hypothetical protein
MRHGLFPKDDISEKDSTEFRRDLTFEGLRPRTYGRMHSLLKKMLPLEPSKVRSPPLDLIDIVLRE